MTSTLTREDVATLEKHGWRRVTENVPGTRQRRPIDQFVIEAEVPGPIGDSINTMASLMRKGPRWQVYRHARNWMPGTASGTVMEDPVALSTYFLMRGDGDLLRGIDRDIEEDWNP